MHYENEVINTSPSCADMVEFLLWFYKKIIDDRKAVSRSKSSQVHPNASKQQSSSPYAASMVDKKSGHKKSQRKRRLCR